MRLLHTSDWHLGRSLHRADLRDAQAGFIDHLVDTVRSERVDVVLLSGDVYDRAIPPLDAVQLCEQAFIRIREAGARVVVISGNHDSARRLGFSSPLIDSSGVYLRTQVAGCATPIVIDGVSFFAVPYLEPEAVRAELGDARGQVGVLTEALARVRAVAPPVSVVLAHAWVAGGAACDSRAGAHGGRRLRRTARRCSTASPTPRSATCTVRRCCARACATAARRWPTPSPRPPTPRGPGWSRSADGLGAVEFVPAPVPRRLSSLRGALDALLRDPALAGAGGRLPVGRPHRHRPAGRGDGPAVGPLPARPRARARTRRSGSATIGSYAATVSGRTDLEIAGAFVEHVRGTPATDGETALLTEALESLRAAG